MLEDHVPYVLGTRPRFVLEGIGNGWRREVSYQIRSDVRGHFDIGPMTVRVSDPFGLVELGRSFRTTVPITVIPRTVPLPQVPLGGAWTGSGDNRPRAFASGSAEDVTVREYRHGDDLRRVHWRSSARTGELMVRREEQPWQSRATLFLDNRSRVPPRPGHRLLARGRGRPRPPRSRCTSASAASPSGWSPPPATTRARPGTSARPSSTPARCWSRWPSSRPWTSSWLETKLARRPAPRAACWSPSSVPSATSTAPVFRRMLHHSMPALAVALDVEAWGGRRGAGPATPAADRSGLARGRRSARATGSTPSGRTSASATPGPPAAPATRGWRAVR